MITFQTPESIKLNTIISRVPKEVLSLVDAANNTSDIQLSDIVEHLQKEGINAIKNDIDLLHSANLKTAKQTFTVGLRQYLTLTGVLSPAYGDNDNVKDSVRWKDTLKRASVIAREAYYCIEVPEDRIECFWIICCCAVLIDSLQKACIRIRNWIDILINQDEEIRKGLEDLKRCVYKNNQRMTLETKDLLSSLFKRLSGALIALFHYYDRNITFGHNEKDKLIRVLKRHPYLYGAAKQPDKWRHINVYHYSTLKRILAKYSLLVPLFGEATCIATSTITFGKRKSPFSIDTTTTMDRYDSRVQSVRQCGTILETGQFLHTIFLKDDFKLEPHVFKRLLAVQTQSEREENCRACIMRKSTLSQYKSIEWYCSLFVALFTVLRFSHFLFSLNYLSPYKQSLRICAPIEFVCLWEASRHS